ncbi:MAG: RNA-binding domain-containing protein [Candidatus Thermoplasmatota archaeon]|nr:RNA-binding domain-containing protein [Candidatus Thermoplasmatota archaeon]
MEAPFHYILLRTFCYSTESENKVREAILFIAYGKNDAEEKIEEHVLEGYFGDKIKIMKLKIENARTIKNFCLRVLPMLDIKKIDESIDEDCSFHLKFSKEKALDGFIALAEDNNAVSLKGKIRVYPSCRESAIGKIMAAVHGYHNN